MTADTLIGQVQLDPTGQLAQDIHCIHCGYNLRSLLPDQNCPECNHSVARSLRSDRLQFSDPTWLRRVCSGMKYILIGSLVGLVAMRILGWAIPGLTLGFTPTISYRVSLLTRVSLLLLFGIPVIGAWRATSPEPEIAGTSRDSRLRLAARILLPVFLLLLAALSLEPSDGTARPATVVAVSYHMRMWLIGAAIWVLIPFMIEPRAAPSKARDRWI